MATFRFTAGPWNVHEGNETFGPGHRKSIPLEEKMKKYAEIGLAGMQFHDDDAVPDMNNMTEKQIIDYAKDVKAMLDKYGLFAEFVAPRLWFDKRTNDGGFTASRKEDREFAQWRARRSCDIAKALGTNKIQLWLAREGTLCAEGKNPVEMTLQLRDAFNDILTYRDDALILVEPKPNEPIDRSICGTAGHALAVGAYTVDPNRVGLCIESAHSILAGLDPANDMGFALALNKLWGVHLNDQNGCRYDQDKAFGVDNLRNAFNQVKVLYENNFGDRGNFECVGLDVKAMRTQPDEDCYRHLINSKKIFEEAAGQGQEIRLRIPGCLRQGAEFRETRNVCHGPADGRLIKNPGCRRSGSPLHIRKMRKTLKTDVFKVFLARKERFELSRAF